MIDNGRPAQVAFGRFAGEMRIEERDGATRLAIWGALRDFRRVGTGMIDGEPWRVIDAAASEYVKGLVVLTVAPVEPGEEPAHDDA